MNFEETPEVTKSSIFLKLKDKETIKGVFRGEPFGYFYNYETKETANEQRPGFTKKYRVNFIIKENGAYVAKIWEFGTKINRQLFIMNKNYNYKLEQVMVSITRHGAPKDPKTEYFISPEPNWLVSPDLERIISQVKLHDLQNKGNHGKKENFESFEEVPF